MHATLRILRIADEYHFTWIGTSFTPTTAHQPTASRSANGLVSLYGTTSADPQQARSITDRIDTSVQKKTLVHADNASASLPKTLNPSNTFESLGRILFAQYIPVPIQKAIHALPRPSTIELITNDTELPWELLHDQNDFLCLQHRIVRTTPVEEVPVRYPIEPTTNINCLFLGNPTADLPAAEEEIAALEDILYAAKPRVRFESIFGDHVTSTLLKDALASKRFGLVHYAGHASEGQLHLADGPFGADQISTSLHNHPVVLLQACSTAATPAETSMDLSGLSSDAESLATAFIKGGATAVVGMLWRVPDSLTKRFSETLHASLVNGTALGEALRLSRVEMREEDPQGISWLAPVLYGNSNHVVFPKAVRKGSGTIFAAQFSSDQTALPQQEGANRDVKGGNHPSEDELLKLCDLIVRSGGSLMQADTARIAATFGIDQPSDNCAKLAVDAAIELKKLSVRLQVRVPSVAIASGDIAVLSAMIHPSSHHSNLNANHSATQPFIYAGQPVVEASALLANTVSGQILLNELARARCANHYLTQPHKLDAEGDAFAGYEVMANRTESSTRSTALHNDFFVGRQRELETLQELWASTIKGIGQAVGIIGEAGIGKTHLVDRFQKEVEQLDAKIHYVNCTLTVQNTPYGLLLRIIRALLDLADVAEPTQIEATITKRFADYVQAKGPDAEADLLILNNMLGVGNDQLQLQSLSVYQHQLYALLKHLLGQALRGGPLLLIVEDMYLSDSASIEILHFLINEIQSVPILLVLAYRTELIVPWSNSDSFQQIHVQELTSIQRQELFKAALSDIDLPEPLIEFIERASGNPLFLTELLVSLNENWQLAESGTPMSEQVLRDLLARLEITDTIQRTIQIRLVSLTDDAKQVLEMAAVLGQNVSMPMLQTGLEMNVDTITKQLKELVAHNFLRHNWATDRYNFRHMLIHDVAYDQIDIYQRQLWHRGVAQELENQSNEEGEDIADITYHYFQSLVEGGTQHAPLLGHSGDPAQVEKTIDYLMHSGKKAMDRYGGQEAERLFGRAKAVAELLPSAPTRDCRIYAALGDAYTFNGKLRDAIASFQLAHGFFHHQPLSADQQPLTADIARKLGRLQMKQGQHALADAWFETGLAYVQCQSNTPSRSATALLHIHRGSNCFDRGDNENARKHGQLGLDIAQQCDNAEVEAEGHFLLGATLQSRGKYEAALDSYKKSLTLQHELKNQYQVHRVEGNIGLVHVYTGSWPLATEYFEKVGSYWMDLNEPDQIALVCLNWGLLNQYRGDWLRASEQYEQALKIWTDLENEYFLTLCYINLASLSIAQEEWETASEYLDNCQQKLEEHDLQDLQPYALCCRSQVALANKQCSLAQEQIELAIKLLNQQNQPPDMATALRILGCVYAAQNKTELAHEQYKKSINISNELGIPCETGWTKYQMALLVKSSDTTKCQRLHDCVESIHIFETLGAEADLAKAYKLRKQIEDEMQ